MDKFEVRFEPWLRQAFELYQRHFAVLLLTHLAAVAISLFTAGLLAGPMSAGAALVTLALLDGREPRPEAGELFHGFDFFLPAFLVGLAVLAANALIWLVLWWIGPLAFAASLFVQTATVFSIYLVIERRMDAVSALRGSFNLAKAAFWPLFGLVAVGSIVAGAGGIFCGIGSVVTLPFYSCLTAIAWRSLSENPAAGTDRITLSPAPPV